MDYIPVSTVDPVTGEGCNAVQRQIWESLNEADWYLREAACRGKMRLAIRRLGSQPLTVEDTLLDPTGVEVLALFDTAGRRFNNEAALHINVLAMQVMMTEFGQIVTSSHQATHGRLMPMPVGRHQIGHYQTIPDGGRLMNMHAEGMYRVRRIGNSLDLCVGELPDGSPAVAYRVDVADLIGRHPSMIVEPSESLVFTGRVTMKHGDVLEVCPVPVGETLARVPRQSTIVQCLHRRGRPVIVSPKFPHINKHHPMAAIAARMNSGLLSEEMTDLKGRGPQAYLVYSRDTTVCLSRLSEFCDSDPALISDIAASLTQEGLLYKGRRLRLQATARVIGMQTVVGIVRTEKHVLVTYQSGSSQLLPASTVLSIEPGDSVVGDQPIGELMPRAESLAASTLWTVFGSCMPEVVTEFLLAVSESHAAVPDHYLIPKRYVTGVESYAETSRQGSRRWFLDVEPVLSYLCPDTNAIVLPPMKFCGGNIVFGDVLVRHMAILSDNYEKKSQERLARYKAKRQKQAARMRARAAKASKTPAAVETTEAVVETCESSPDATIVA